MTFKSGSSIAFEMGKNSELVLFSTKARFPNTLKHAAFEDIYLPPVVNEASSWLACHKVKQLLKTNQQLFFL